MLYIARQISLYVKSYPKYNIAINRNETERNEKEKFAAII